MQSCGRCKRKGNNMEPELTFEQHCLISGYKDVGCEQFRTSILDERLVIVFFVITIVLIVLLSKKKKRK